MESKEIVLTDKDKLILESYKLFATGLSNYLGEHYEIVLHSLDNYSKSAIKVLNGYQTGRKEGAPITDLALEMLSRINDGDSPSYISYYTQNIDKNPMKSSTIAIIGENERIIGLMCINFNLNTPFYKVIENIFPQSSKGMLVTKENFVDNTSELIKNAVLDAKQQVLSTPTISANNRNFEIISILQNQGIFNLKDSVSKTAKYLNISKNTVYMHIRTLNE